MDQKEVEGLTGIEGSHVKPGTYLMLKGRPTSVVKATFAKPGKHGHVKCNIVAKDLLKVDKKYQHMCPGHDNIYQPVVKKYDLVLSYPEYEDSTETDVSALVCMEDDDSKTDEITLIFQADQPTYVQAVKLFKEIEENDEDKEVILSIVQCTVGDNKFKWEHTIAKVTTREAKN